MENFDDIPAILNEPIFQKAFATAKIANLTREQYTAYEENLLDYWGVKAAVDTARNEGRAEGREAERLETARAMLSEGVDDATILRLTKLSPSNLAALQQAR